jgi:hypothetical protein
VNHRDVEERFTVGGRLRFTGRSGDHGGILHWEIKRSRRTIHKSL